MNINSKSAMLQKLIFISFLLFSKASIAQIKIGDKAPNVNVTNWIQNQPKNISLKDQFIVIDFWATWCAPCLASMAHMNRLVEENKTKNNLVFLAMSDEAKEKISSVLLRVLFKASVVTDTTHVTQVNFKITSIPHCTVIDDKGFVRWAGNPKELTNDILQDILSQKRLDIANHEENTSKYFASQYDSLGQEYRKIFDNDSIKEYFSLGPFLSEGYGSTYSRKFTDYLRKVEIGIKLKDMISEQESISSNQISLPPDIDNVYTSYCYKSEKRLKSEDVLHSIFTTANLAYNKKDSIQKALLLEVGDLNLLNKSFLKNGKEPISHLSVSDNEKFIAMSNNSIFNIISALQNRFDCPIILKDSSILNKPLDMMLQTDDLKTLKNSLKFYGLNIIEKKQTLPFLTVVHK